MARSRPEDQGLTKISLGGVSVDELFKQNINQNIDKTMSGEEL